MKHLLLGCLFSLICSSSLCGQYLESKSSITERDFKQSNLFSGKVNPTDAFVIDSKFKKNRKTINYTALGLLGLGTTIGLIYTIDCKRTSFGDDQCGLGVYLGAVFGATAGLVTLLVAHPINRIKNKGRDYSEIKTYQEGSGTIVSYGLLNGSLGVTLRF